VAIQQSARLDGPFATLAGWRPVIQITAQMRELVAIEPVDGTKGIDSLMRLCQEKLAEDPFSGCVFVCSYGNFISTTASCDRSSWSARQRWK
jgi:hypothetical protein